jgi:P-type Ca2+ transporter type 2C
MSRSPEPRESPPTPFWSFPAEEVLATLQTTEKGLSTDEAKKRLKRFGANAIQEQKRLTKLTIIAEQIKSPLILILILAGSVTGFLREWVDTGVIFAAVIANTLLGFWQENKAQTVLEKLASYIRTRARVRRDGHEFEIDASELVPGDIIRVSQGERIPADGRIFFANGLEVDDAILTGESLPVEKHSEAVGESTSLSDRKCMVYGGTLAVQGVADVVVTATGAQTEFGRIAALTSERRTEQTPLQKAVGRFANMIGLILLVLTTGLFALGWAVGHDPVEMFLIAVAVAVSAVPEGLPVSLTVILAVGVERLAKRNGIVRKLLAAEALGSTSLILTDKTGTLTQAKMKLATVVPHQASGDEAEHDLLVRALLNLDVVVENPEEPHASWRVIGRPMEVALVQNAAERDVPYPDILKATNILQRLPFGSAHKYSGAIMERDGKREAIILGAPEIILDFTDLPETERERIRADIDERAGAGARILGVISKDIIDGERLAITPKPSGYQFIGILAFRDPLRPKVRDAVRRIGQSGVQTVIVTGDHKGTAEAVARELGIMNGRQLVISGEELASYDERRLSGLLDKVAVFARVTPEQKAMLVRAFKKHGEVVAVTGDGVNDAPALQVADIGVAVGSGTDVAKGAADLVILDDDYETIVVAIEEGRNILGNIKKVIVYLLSNSLDSVFLIGGALAFGVPIPLNALQILYVNFFSDSFPAIAYAFENQNGDTDTHPSKIKGSILDTRMKFLIIFVGASSSVILFVLYYFLPRMGHPIEVVRTFIFACFACNTLIRSFALRSLKRSIFTFSPFSNPALLLGVGIGFILTGLALFQPFMMNVLGHIVLPLPWFGAIALFGAANILGAELIKWMFRNRAT